MAKFNLNNKSSAKTLKEKAKFLEHKVDFDFRQIPFEEIKVNDKNFYNVQEVDDLAKSIKDNGLMHNIEVLEVLEDTGRYFRILSGERRYQAIKKLRGQGIKFDCVPCKVMKGLDEIEEEIHVIKGNSDTRILSEEEKRLQIKRLNELYSMKNEYGDEKINAKREIAKELQMSERTIERYNNINNKLIPELQEFFDKKLITLTDADKFAKLDEQMQLSILELLQSQSKVSKEELEVIKEENKKLRTDKSMKEKELKDKEKQIEEIEREADRIREALRYKVEEKKKLEVEIAKKIKEENKEEVEKLEEMLKSLNEESKELALKEKDLTKDNKGLLKQIEELEKKITVNANRDIKREVAKEKVKDLKNQVKSQVNNLINIITDNELYDITAETIEELEDVLDYLKVKIQK